MHKFEALSFKLTGRDKSDTTTDSVIRAIAPKENIVSCIDFCIVNFWSK